MTDIVRVKDEYYVRASSALADDRTRVLKYGDTFAVFNRYGDIETFGPSQFGLFHAESRHLSPFTMRVNQQQPLLLSSTIHQDNAFLSVDLTNLDSPSNSDDDTLPRGTVHIFRLQFLRKMPPPIFLSAGTDRAPPSGRKRGDIEILKSV